MKLTGRKRYRIEKPLFRKPRLVLQLEETGRETEFLGGYIEHYTVNRWRDATVEDLSVEGVE
jgi:hypothetical protein